MTGIRDELERARTLFRAFHGRNPRGSEIVEINPPSKPVVLLEVGSLVQLAYHAKGNGKFYRHNFQSPLARVYVTYDGGQAYIIGGGYRFSPKGFLR